MSLPAVKSATFPHKHQLCSDGSHARLLWQTRCMATLRQQLTVVLQVLLHLQLLNGILAMRSSVTGMATPVISASRKV